MKKMKEKDMTVRELSELMLKSFQANQEYMDKNFEQVGENFKQVTQKINNISLNIVDVVRKNEFDKLKKQVFDVEEVAGLRLKKA